MTRFVVVPQWQGSPSSRAMHLVDGAEAIAGDLPRAATTRVAVPLEAGEALETGVARYSALRRIRHLVDETLAAIPGAVLLVGGDCAVSLPGIAHARARHPRLAVVWFDAHPDLHRTDTSVSGAFAGMAVRAVLGEGPSDLVVAPGIPSERVVLVGARDIDDDEPADDDLLRVSVEQAREAGWLAERVAATGAEAVYIHVDLDVLDPAAVVGVTAAVPFGLSTAELLAAIGALRARLPLGGAGISGFAPSSPAAAVEDLGTILRVVGALA